MSGRRFAAALALGTLLLGCRGGPAGPQHRERSAARDVECRDPDRPSAYFYPARDRTEYGPDDPRADGCSLLVADHLFCCPDAPRASDR